MKDREQQSIDESGLTLKANEFPSGLTPKDIELIMSQCEHQMATSREQVLGFANAYLEAKQLAADRAGLETLVEDEVADLIMRWSVMIEKSNETGFRTVPVRFADFAFATDPELIPRAMQQFVGMYTENLVTPLEAYKEFEKIHPFKDGNGRLGDLLWKVSTSRETGKWPEELPPKIF